MSVKVENLDHLGLVAGVIKAQRRDPDRRPWGDFQVPFVFASNGRPETDPFA